MSTEREFKKMPRQHSRKQFPLLYRAIAATTLMSVAVPLLSSCGFGKGENTIVVRVQGTPGIPYEVKLDAGNDTDVQRGNGDDEFTFVTDDCLVSVSVNSNESDTLYVGLWINDEYDDRDTSSSGFVMVSGSCL